MMFVSCLFGVFLMKKIKLWSW